MDVLFIVTPIVVVCNCSMFCCTLLCIRSSIAIILMGKRELVSRFFQAISVGKKTYAEMKNIQIAEVNITCEENVKLLGVELDYKLNFDTQITKMCKKSS